MAEYASGPRAGSSRRTLSLAKTGFAIRFRASLTADVHPLVSTTPRETTTLRKGSPLILHSQEMPPSKPPPDSGVEKAAGRMSLHEGASAKAPWTTRTPPGLVTATRNEMYTSAAATMHVSTAQRPTLRTLSGPRRRGLGGTVRATVRVRDGTVASSVRAGSSPGAAVTARSRLATSWALSGRWS